MRAFCKHRLTTCIDVDRIIGERAFKYGVLLTVTCNFTFSCIIIGRVTNIVKGFNIDWKNSIEKINGEIMLEFANFTLGTQIFHVS